MKITIRKAKSEDAPHVAPIMLEAMREIVYTLIDSKNDGSAIQFLTQFISSEHNQYSYENIWVATEDDRILGEICLYDGADLLKLRTPVLSYVNGDDSKRFDSIEDETASGEFYIDTIAVSPAARGKGVGQLLLHHVIEMYVLQRNLTLGLLVDKGNPKAKSLYLRTGFVYREDVFYLGKTMEHLQLSPSQ